LKSDDLTPSEKKELAFLLKKIKIMPIRPGRIIIETTVEQTIGKVEVINIYR
jgi:hypothetical protein